MKRLIEFPLEDGSTILVESNEPEPEAGIVRAARPVEVIVRASQTFEHAIDVVRPAAATILNKLRALHDQPDEIEVEFGLKINVEAGAFVASAGMDANYTVRLKWKKPESPAQPEKL